MSCKIRMISLLLAMLVIAWGSASQAASHREAPLIASDPAADNTDTYLFRSWEDPSKVVFILNVNPGQNPADGPNYFNFGDDVVYRFNIDTTGMARPTMSSTNFVSPLKTAPSVRRSLT